MDGGHHNYQWGKTQNAVNVFCDFYDISKTKSQNEEGMGFLKEMKEIFMEQEVFATEKLDGTNVCKDEFGQIYGRRCFIGKQSQFYQKTSLEKVKQADIAKLKMYMCKEASIDPSKMQTCHIYGELMCNSIYDYKQRGLVGGWRVFGAIVELRKEDSTETYEKLNKAGFLISKDSVEERIRIFPCIKFFFCVTECGMETVNVKSNGGSIAQIVSDNLEDMRRGKLEGIIFTIPIFDDEGQGHKVVKWKGAQEYQPSAEQCLNSVIAKIESHLSSSLSRRYFVAGQCGQQCCNIETKDFPAELKMFYRNLAAALFSAYPAINIRFKRRVKQETPKSLENVPKPKKDFGDGFSPDDKKMIIHGIYHSMNKFDDIAAIYSAKGSIGIETYIKILQDESWKHYVEEKMITDPYESEKEVVDFINSSVVKIVNKLHKKDQSIGK